jgi:exonuclease SbcC
VRLVRIEARDFAQYDALDLDLSQVQSVAVVGENGSGKSRLLDAVLWSLYGRSPDGGTVDRLVRRGERTMRVRTTWDKDGTEVVVQRERSIATKAGESTLDLRVDGLRRTKHTIAETQAVIDALVGLPYAVMLAGSVMVQGQSDALMAADPAERKTVLGRLFGLDEYALFHDEAKARVADDQGRLAFLGAEIERLEELLAAAARDEIEERHAAAEAEAQRARMELESVRRRVDALRTEAEVLHEKGKRLNELDERLQATNARATMAHDRLEQLGRQETAAKAELEGPYVADPLLRSAIVAVRSAKAELDEAQLERAGVAAKVNQLKAALVTAEQHGLCDRCPFRVDVGEFRSLEERANRLDDRLAELRMAAAALPEMEAALARQEAHDVRRQMLAGLEQMTSALREQEQSANDEATRINAERLRLQQEADRMIVVASLLQEAVQAFQTAEEATTRADAELRRLDARVEELRLSRALLERRAADGQTLRERVERGRLVERMFHRDGIPAMVLAQGLAMIETKANDVLGRMPGGLRMALLTERQTKAGTTRDTLDVVVDQDGHETAYELLSGAERFRVDFALRLGVAEVLAHRTGAAFDTLWLDEPFSAQDRKALETLMECLSSVAGDFGLMVVVTHQPEVADRFPARVVVTKEDGVATAELAA